LLGPFPVFAGWAALPFRPHASVRNRARLAPIVRPGSLRPFAFAVLHCVPALRMRPATCGLSVAFRRPPYSQRNGREGECSDAERSTR
jgi:hypothetical protein